MNIRTLATCIGTVVFLAACSGGGSNSTPAVSNNGSLAPGSTTVQQVTGTLTIGTSSLTSASSTLRKPAFVSAATTHAYVFIDGSSSPNNASSTCTGTVTTGTGVFCTITWSVSLVVPASYIFKVETDNGTNVLAEGSASYAIIAGSNTLGALTLNGVVAKASFATTSCVAGAAGSAAGTCNGTVTLDDAAANAIAYGGATTVPAVGNSPTTGTVLDNGAVTFVSSGTACSGSSCGLVIGTAQTSGSNVFSTYASNTLTASGVNTNGIYTYEVQCATGTTTGTFGITVGGGTSRTSGVNITDTQLGTESPVPTYLASVSTIATAPSYTCTNGVISSATGTLPIN